MLSASAAAIVLGSWVGGGGEMRGSSGGSKWLDLNFTDHEVLQAKIIKTATSCLVIVLIKMLSKLL